MEYSISNGGELVLSSQSRYLPESIPHNSPNTKVVLLPVSYRGTRAPEAQYQSFQQAPYFAEVPLQSLPAHQTLQGLTFQAQTLQTRNPLEVPYQSHQACRSLQAPSHQAQSLSESSYPSLQAPTHSTFQAQSLSAPVHQSIEDMFPMNNTLISSTAYTGNEMLAGQDTRQSKENFDIDMATSVLPEAVEGMVTDTITPTLVETPQGTVCRSCVSLKRLA